MHDHIGMTKIAHGPAPGWDCIVMPIRHGTCIGRSHRLLLPVMLLSGIKCTHCAKCEASMLLSRYLRTITKLGRYDSLLLELHVDGFKGIVVFFEVLVPTMQPPSVQTKYIG